MFSINTDIMCFNSIVLTIQGKKTSCSYFLPPNLDVFSPVQVFVVSQRGVICRSNFNLYGNGSSQTPKTLLSCKFW